MKEIEDDTKKWKVVLCSWIGRINIVKTSLLPKAIYIFNEIAIKISMTSTLPIEKNNFKRIILLILVAKSSLALAIP